jgi:hypothetical protein
MNPANKFPRTRLDQRQEFTGMKDSLVGLIHLISAAKHRAAYQVSHFVDRGLSHWTKHPAVIF